jgi:hypothetical protein
MMTLRAEGFCFDVVEEVIDLRGQIIAPETTEVEMLSEAAAVKMSTELAVAMRSIKDRARKFRRKITPTDPRRFLNEPNFDFVLNNPYAPDVTRLDLVRRWKALLAEEGIPSEFENGEDPQLRWFAYIWPVIRGFSFWLPKRCLFMTSTGSIGLGPSDIRRGDEVVILFGASVPFMLRRRTGHHILLGDCAVSGIMEGEMACIFEYEVDNADGLQPQFFTLR